MKHLIHEWRMRQKIKAILKENHAHPEHCLHLEDFIGVNLNMTKGEQEPLTLEQIEKARHLFGKVEEAWDEP